MAELVDALVSNTSGGAVPPVRSLLDGYGLVFISITLQALLQGFLKSVFHYKTSFFRLGFDFFLLCLFLLSPGAA